MRLINMACTDDLELNAEVPASVSFSPCFGHYQLAIQYVPHVRLPRNGVYRRHCLSERKGNCFFFVFTQIMWRS